MKHLDEGTLQLWLDRARSGLDAEERGEIERHLSGCATCAERLEALEQDSRRTQALLSVPLPGEGEVPDFDEVKARAVGGARPERGRRRWRPALWAASVALALGVGWMANELQRRPLGLPSAQAPAGDTGSARTVTTEAAGPAGSGEARAAEARTAETRTAATPAPSTTLADQGSPAPAGPAVARPTMAEEALAQGVRTEALQTAARADPEAPSPGAAEDEPGPIAAEAIARRPAEDLPPSPVEVAERASMEALTALSGTDRPAVVRGRVTDEAGRPLPSAQVYVAEAGVGTLTDQDGLFELAFQDLTADSAAREIALSVDLLGFERMSRTLALRGGESVSTELRLSNQAMSLDEVVVTGQAGEQDRGRAAPDRTPVARRAAAAGRADAAAAPAWRTVTLTDARSEADFRPWAVAELAVARVEMATMGATTLLRMTQTLEGGGELELVQAPASVEAPPLPAADGRAVATVRRGDVVVVAAAPLSRSELLELLERLAPTAPRPR